MPKFILAYHGGRKPATPEEGARHMARFMEWMGSVGDAMVSPANPVGASKIVSADGVSEGGGPNALTGYSIIDVENIEVALDIAKRCPFVDIGTIEVAPLLAMGPRAWTDAMSISPPVSAGPGPTWSAERTTRSGGPRRHE